MKKWLSIMLLLAMIAPSQALAHIEPIKRPVLYRQTVSITGVSLIDDDNWFGPADVFFDSIVNAVSPEHDEQSVFTSETIPVSSGETVMFEPIEVYSHDMCHCDEEFDVDIAVFDYAPVQHFLVGLLGKLFDWGTTYVTSGMTGLIIHLVGDVFDLIVEELGNQGLSDEDAAYQAYVKIINNSDFLGAMREIRSTECEPGEEDFVGNIFWEGEKLNGQVHYRIKKTDLGDACPIPEDEVGTVPEGEDAATEGGETTLTTPPDGTDISEEGTVIEKEPGSTEEATPSEPNSEETLSEEEKEALEKKQQEEEAARQAEEEAARQAEEERSSNPDTSEETSPAPDQSDGADSTSDGGETVIKGDVSADTETVNSDEADTVKPSPDSTSDTDKTDAPPSDG